MKNKEEKKKKGSWGGDNPAHNVYFVCYNNRGKGIESRFSKNSNFELYNENYYILQENFSRLFLKLARVPKDFISNGIEFL